ncbi:MAG: pyridoxal 5'-phosphate synthase glutaminase subunit PdxT [Candidatus Altiarchaeales archaeon]|nr:pyridoxal 5'-phosphate synthase glutaminase subunit PdxT [Candidatus Altiarchaeota archaeon]MBU4341885.1 pyridoxal 5'-phosphate synthase glutaminase subunit PdxT [Candidatus Altiarchaeota archaeon]MCG2782930.1 pyridoxal 5'-phosphate synthase glutaminase subunit PdxT [Candidatus Altiarchaeales archaeon]
MRVGILALQGDVSEHLVAMRNAMGKMKIGGEVIEVKRKDELKDLDSLVIPGGESTAIGKLIAKYGIDSEIKNLAKKGIPIMGTCAGLVLVAKEGDEEVAKTGQPLLGLMDIKVKRNAFGRQRESFEADLEIGVLGKEPYHTVFIRAPAIDKTGKGVDVLARFEDKVVMARQRNLLAVAFHPELTSDSRLHEYFLGMGNEDSR